MFDFGYKDWIVIQEFYYDESTNYIERTLFGDLFMSKDRNKLTINVIEDDSWSGRNGLMISAPAKNRKEALAISNEVMRTFFNGWFSKFE